MRAKHVSEAFVVATVTNSANLFTAAAAFRTALLTVRYFHGSRNNVVSTVPRVRTGRSAVRILATKSIFIFSETFRPALVYNQPPIQLVPGIRQPGRDAGHSPPYNTELRMGGFTTPSSYMP